MTTTRTLLTKKELWLRLRDYQFAELVPASLWHHVQEVFSSESASTHAFADKIARKHCWKVKFALKAIFEYKKFVYLAMVGDRYVTPSKVIDVVWHEHMLFTRAYREFCLEMFGRMFDHNPELVPEDEQTAVFQAQYLYTLELYEQEFGRAPREDVWATPKFGKEIRPNGVEARKKKREERIEFDVEFDFDETPLHQHLADDAEFAGPEHGIIHSLGDFVCGDGDSGGHADGCADAGGDGGGDGGGCSGGCGGE